MALGDFITADPVFVREPQWHRYGLRRGQHLQDPAFISARIRERGHHEWTPEKIKEAVELWLDGLNKLKLAQHFGVTRESVVGMIFRNRALFRRREKHMDWRFIQKA